LGDIISVIDGRDSLIAEMSNADPVLRQGIAEALDRLLATRGFVDSLPGHLPGDAASQERLPDLMRKLRRIVALAT
jgi:hypothetical protein